MALRSLGALALASACAVSAFQNTSPFFLFSNTDQLQPFDNANPQLLAAKTLDTYLTQSLKECAEDYIIVRQNGVSASDYQDGSSAPYLSGWLGGKDAQIKQTMVVPDVAGLVNVEAIKESIYSKCRGRVESYSAEVLSDHRGKPFTRRNHQDTRVITITFPALPVENPAEKLADYDSLLSDFIHNHMGSEQWTVFYTTTPRDEQVAEELATQTYEMDEPFPNAVNIELKRDVGSHADDKLLEGGLFEKYMFLSPGIFMGLTAALPLFLILYVGISALTGLEVSYFAFSKEMGPAGQKKQ